MPGSIWLGLEGLEIEAEIDGPSLGAVSLTRNLEVLPSGDRNVWVLTLSSDCICVI